MKAVKKASTGALVNGNGDPKYTKTKTKKAPMAFTKTIEPLNSPSIANQVSSAIATAAGAAGGQVSRRKSNKKKS